MPDRHPEACGRCSFSAVVDAVQDGDGEGDRPGPMDGERIELTPEEARRTLKPQAVAGRYKRALDALGRRLTVGR